MLQSEAMDPAMPMTSDQKDLIEQENHWRDLFYNDPGNDELKDPHLGLISVYDQYHDFQYQEETEDEKKVPKVLVQSRQVDLSGSAIVSKEKFLKNWEEITQGCLEGLDWNNVFVAGGSVLGCLMANQDDYRGSDIDIFIWGITDESIANQKIKEIYQLIIKNTQGKGDILRTNRALTILCAYPFRHVQIILRLYHSPGQVLLGFDIDSCCVGFDGEKVWSMERFRRALSKRYNLVNASRRSNTYEQRLFKYSKRGFAVAVPNLDKGRINPLLFEKNIREVHGLMKLLIYDYNLNTGRPNYSRTGRSRRVVRDETEEGSDYNNELPIPWGPEWQTEKIIQLVNVKNKAKFFSALRKNKKQEEQGENPPPLTYNHIFTCSGLKLEAGEWNTWKRSLDGVEVDKPLEWIKDNPAYQDFDNDYRRLMTGSFEPAVADNWSEGVYLDPNETSRLPLIGISRNSGSKSTTPIVDLFLEPSSRPPVPWRKKETKPHKFASRKKKEYDEEEEDDEEYDEEEEESVSPVPAKQPTKRKTQPPFGVPSGPSPPLPNPTGYSFFDVSKTNFKSDTQPKGFPMRGPTQPAAAGFSFGGKQPQPAPTSFGFGGAPTQQPASNFSFGGAPAQPETTSFGFGGTTQQPASSFSFGGAPAQPATTSFGFGGTTQQPASSFSFGGAPAQQATTSFGFGGAPTTQQPASSFSFGGAPAPPSSSFGFGGTTAQQQHPSSNFSFGGAPAQQATTSFGFGGAPSTKPTATTSFSFGGAPEAVSISQQTKTLKEEREKLRRKAPEPGSVPSTSFSTTVTATPAASTPSTSTKTSVTKLLLLVSLANKKGNLTPQEKGKLKDLIIVGNQLLISALEVFEIDQDFAELTDTFKRIAKLT